VGSGTITDTTFDVVADFVQEIKAKDPKDALARAPVRPLRRRLHLARQLGGGMGQLLRDTICVADPSPAASLPPYSPLLPTRPGPPSAATSRPGYQVVRTV